MTDPFSPDESTTADGPSPNPRQQELVDSLEGIHVVDAGAGTGKTFSITRRYVNILESTEADPADVALFTFTENAAAEMRDRIVRTCEYPTSDLVDAPIQTFHSFCHDLLQSHGHAAPTLLDVDERITDATRLVDTDVVESQLFGEFFDRFTDRHPEYEDCYRILREDTTLLSLVNELAAKGVFPTQDGWYRDGEAALDGDLDSFEAQFHELNEPRNDGTKQSKLRSKLNGYDGDDDRYLPDAPPKHEIRGEGKQVPADLAERVFDEDRTHLKAFVHDVYHEYLQFALGRNYLTFGFLQGLAFVLLCEDDALREAVAFESVMVDEFQDTSAIQFKLALLVAGTENLCVVGDWKQSIYSFQYAAVENITDFEDRLQRFTAELNSDRERVSFSVDDVTEIAFTENYRSTQAILDVSEESLVTPATKRESLEEESIREAIVSLQADTDQDDSRIEAIHHEDEYGAVLRKIQAMVGNDEYVVVDDETGEQRPPRREDIAVLTRTRDWGRELQQVADDHGIPMAYEGGVELFETDQALLLLAWLRILEHAESPRGWAVVLERAGYGVETVQHILDEGEYPQNMLAFRERLADCETVGAVAQAVFQRYGYDGAYASALTETLQDVFDSTRMTWGDLVRFMTRALDAETTVEVNDTPGTDAVTVQTIHAAKGLEHPIVVVANLNQHRFPSTGGGGSVLRYDGTLGLRQSKVYGEDHGYPHVYDNWRHDVLSACSGPNYDEERRLLYVAMTRAESHLVFTAGENPSAFFEELPVEGEVLEPDIADQAGGEAVQATLDVGVPTPSGPKGASPHSLMSDVVFEELEAVEGRGMEYGRIVHEFAERYARGEDVEPEPADERAIAEFLDDQSGELVTEEWVYLPLSVDGEQVTVTGIVDLLVVEDDRVQVVDYKTDRSRRAHDEYRKQVSVYYHVVAECYPERAVETGVFYSDEGEFVPVEPLSRESLETLL
jgi:superfamily I DNA/RNA helicase